MFTGIVAELGEVAGIEHRGDAARLTIRGSTDDVAPGESIAVNGVCLTVIPPILRSPRRPGRNTWCGRLAIRARACSGVGETPNRR